MKKVITLVVLLLLLAFSCGQETRVINVVHEDGSITRTVIIKADAKDYLQFDRMAVPIDSTWQIRMDTLPGKINGEGDDGDSILYLEATKHFESVDEINQTYTHDSSANKRFSRKAAFAKRFRWFTTVYRYSETVGRIYQLEVPVANYLSTEEQEFFNLPNSVKSALLTGKDSTHYHALSDSLEDHFDVYFWNTSIRQWVSIFFDHFGDDPNLTMTKSDMLAKEEEVMSYLIENRFGENVDSIFLVSFGQPFYDAFKTEIDSTTALLEVASEPFFESLGYDMEIRMPGKVIGTNGYLLEKDTVDGVGQGLLWTVEGSRFLTEDYEMWVESRVNNYSLWVVTGIFIGFISIGLVRLKRKSSVDSD
ncbi:hypothetical protein [Marinoscillum sp. MHG1-6]|uniref:hypothetical protein n=1 Tax=Marinoscillum sp. MHG1-6 TaxID=2959627 RepID=UPI0021572E03|nr:hypothetical protein [Marinoscillum sp. MHG1-6]